MDLRGLVLLTTDKAFQQNRQSTTMGSPAGVPDGGVQQGLYAGMWHPTWGYGTIQCHMAATGYTWIGLKGTGLSNIRRVDTLPQSVNMLKLLKTLEDRYMVLLSIQKCTNMDA